MSQEIDYLEMIKQAQLNSRESLSRLAEEARGRIFVYIYRITLNYHLAQDLSQETMLEMIKALQRLKIESANSFWAWLYRTALGKVQHHYKYRGNRRVEQRTIFDGGELLKNCIAEDRRSAAEKLLKSELSQVVLKAIGQMNLLQRNILTLRCFNEMSYADIARITGGTQMQARLQFFRAKQALKKRLAQKGYKKEYFLSGLGLFGAITAYTTKPALASVSVATTKVGIIAAVVGTLTTTSGIVAVSTAVILTLATVGTVKVVENNSTRFYSDRSIFEAIKSDAFALPSSLIRDYDPRGRGWRAQNPQNYRQPSVPILPENILVGQRQPEFANLIIILPGQYWFELGYSSEILDGPGIDICYDAKVTGELPQIFLTDGQGQEVQITSEPVFMNGGGGWRYTAYDISGLSLPFKPRAIRVVGRDNTGQRGGAELYAVWARVSR